MIIYAVLSLMVTVNVQVVDSYFIWNNNLEKFEKPIPDWIKYGQIAMMGLLTLF